MVGPSKKPRKARSKWAEDAFWVCAGCTRRILLNDEEGKFVRVPGSTEVGHRAVRCADCIRKGALRG